MKKIEIVKEVGQIVVGVGVGNIIGGIVATNVPFASASLIKKVCTGAGAVVLSNMVNEKAGQYYNRKFDEITEKIKNLVNEEEQE